MVEIGDDLEFCVDCGDPFRYDDCGGYNPPCACGAHCRSCHEAMERQNNNDGFGYDDDFDDRDSAARLPMPEHKDRVEPIRYDQTPGGCWVACIAGLTGLPREELEALVPRGDDGGIDASMGTEYHNAINAYLRSHGWRIAHLGTDAPRGFAIGSGISPRGILHAVLACDGALWHDPHPSRGGIVGEWTEWEVLVPLAAPIADAWDSMKERAPDCYAYAASRIRLGAGDPILSAASPSSGVRPVDFSQWSNDRLSERLREVAHSPKPGRCATPSPSSGREEGGASEAADRMRKVIARKVQKSRTQNYEPTMVTVGIAELESVLAEVASRREERGAAVEPVTSISFGDLPDGVRAIYRDVTHADGGHVWDNLTPSEQRDWCIEQLVALRSQLAEREREIERLTGQLATAQEDIKHRDERWQRFRDAVLATDALFQRIASLLVDLGENETAAVMRETALVMFTSVQDEAVARPSPTEDAAHG